MKIKSFRELQIRPGSDKYINKSTSNWIEENQRVVCISPPLGVKEAVILGEQKNLDSVWYVSRPLGGG